MSTATELKDQGNALFKDKKYQKAIAKYTEAINLDRTNAILFSNRAQCLIFLRRFEEAREDGLKATEIDPTYSKGWSRLATAYQSLVKFDEGLEAWSKAIDCISPDSASPADLALRKEYESKRQILKEHPRLVTISGPPPWEMCAAIEHELIANAEEMKMSSAWVIMAAYQEFSEGIKTMNAVKEIKTPQGAAFFGVTGGLEALLNGILSDFRVFHFRSNSWVTHYNRMVTFETLQRGAWDRGDIEEIKTKVVERVRTKGWDNARPAIATTVRAWIMRGFGDSQREGMQESALKLFRWAVELIRWGQEEWKDVPTEQRGVIFKDTFSWGVRNLYLEVIMQSNPSGTVDIEKFELLLKVADELISEIQSKYSGDIRTIFDQWPAGERVTPGFVSSYIIYPQAQAYAMKGLYYSKRAVFEHQMNNKAKANEYCKTAGENYLRSADFYPEDDEKHPWMLKAAFDNLRNGGAKPEDLRDIVNRVRQSIPKMMRIWKNSALATQGRDAALEQLTKLPI